MNEIDWEDELLAEQAAASYSEVGDVISEAKTEADDPVNHPKHYSAGGYEAIKVIEAWELGFCLGNTVKYISRAGKKAGNSELQDLEKAQWYLARRIEQIKGQK